VSRVARTAAVVLVATACSSTFGMPQGATDQGRDIADLWRTFFVAALVVAAIVYGLIGWSLIRYRRRRREDPEALGGPRRANVPLEIVYTSVPIIIVVVLFVLTYRTEHRVDAVTDTPDLVVRVEAFSWGWRFAYPDADVQIVSPPSGPGIAGPELYLPQGETVRIDLSSSDVIHAFWVPGFDFKRDAIPGHTTSFDLTPVDLGAFRGACSEFCGLNHAFMNFTVRVVPPASFASWLTEQARTGPTA
jgi:cytochrome c oxidase subunit II